MWRGVLGFCLVMVLCTGCGTTLVVGPTFSTIGEGSGVMVSVEQRLHILDRKEQRLGFVAKTATPAGWTGALGGYAGAGLGASYVVMFRESEYWSQREYSEPVMAAGVEEEGVETTPQKPTPFEARATGFFSMGLAGGYLYGSKRGGELWALMPEFDLSLRVASWGERLVLVGGRLQCLGTREAWWCGPAVTTTFLHEDF